MATITKTINNTLFKITCDDCLEEQAQSLLQVIGDIDSSKLKDQFKIQVGWNIFTLVEEDGFKVVAPDYDANPFTDTTDDLTIALFILLEQSAFLNKLNLEGETISFQDKIVYSKRVFELDDIYLERSKERDPGESGWYIGPVEGEAGELGACYAFQLLNVRPAIIEILALPGGCLAVYEGDELKAVLDENDVDLLK